MKIKVKPVIEIGCHNFKVYQNEQVYEDGHDATTSFRTRQINIAPNISKSRKATALIHEGIHIISEIYSTALSERDTELLGEGLGQLLFGKHNLGIELDWGEIETIKVPE